MHFYFRSTDDPWLYMNISALISLVRRFGSDNSGATAVEYGILIGMIFLILAGITALGGGVGALFNSVQAKASAAIGH